MDNKNCQTSSGLVYSYNIPKQYNGTTTSSVSCYKTAQNYGACQKAQIVPPSPTTVTPTIFELMKPHPFKNKIVPTLYSSNDYSYRGYNNGSGNEQYGSDGANKNTNDTYRKISMPNEALACGGLGTDIYLKKFEPGFNDVAYMS
jgi:hypothetical protein